MTSGRFVLYRFFDFHGDLLYIGKTVNPRQRLSSHSKLKDWYIDVANVELETFPSEEELDKAEVSAIKSEKPKHNIQHNTVTVNTTSSLTISKIFLRCMKCHKSIGDDGAIYLPGSEMRKNRDSRKRQEEYEKGKKDASGSRYVTYSASELLEYGEISAKWYVHCTPCMKPCIDHPSNEDYDDQDECDGCGGHYWFHGERANTWPKIIEWTAHLMEKSWLEHTNWEQILRYILQHNGGMPGV